MIRRSRADAGFSLLEVLVATVILGVAVTSLIVGLSQSVKNASRLSDYDRSATLARNKMNDLLLDADLPFDGEVEGQFDKDAGWRAVVRPFEQPPQAGPGTPILQRIALEVWWQPATGPRRTIQVAGYRSTRIPAPPVALGVR
ncbi:MAG TPA: prepilin-type N-terminal cleavage/methylation domain-containing protein [Bryobacteraceae bacterium]|nr:prepilin-type N-terminal cleavage/methylation domain-containing protein [Bryobacteraceae bacterium]